MASHVAPRKLKLLRVAQRIRVPAGFILAPLLLIAGNPGRNSVAAGSAVAVLGLGLRAWASGCLRKNEELAMSGPYAYTRNPLYLGTFLLGLGISICTGSWWFACFFSAFYLFVYIPVMIAEAETLGKLFPEQYKVYSENVPLLVPRLTRFDPGTLSNAGCPRDQGGRRLFDFSLYVRHREYRALLGFVAVLFILILKAWIRF